jgi:hypothetical protein
LQCLKLVTFGAHSKVVETIHCNGSKPSRTG